jgi:cysteine synthase A
MRKFLLGFLTGLTISGIIRFLRNKFRKIPLMLEAMVGNTPIFTLKSFPNIILKAEFMNLGGSPKDRLAYGILKREIDLGVLREGDTVFEGTVGSTGISLALMSRGFGLKCHIVMPDDQALEKYKILEILGATVEKVKPASIIDPNHFVNIARQRAEEMNAAGKRAYFINQFENPLNSEIHFLSTGPEIYDQTNGEIDAIVLGSGTGGTMSGVARYLKSKIPELYVVLADPQGSGLYSKVKYDTLWSHTDAEGTRKRHQVDTVVEGVGLNRLTANFKMALDFIDNAISVTDQEAVDVSRMVLEREGLFIGSSSAVNLAAALKLQGILPKGSRILTLLPDHGSRHVTKFWNDNYLKDLGLQV